MPKAEMKRNANCSLAGVAAFVVNRGQQTILKPHMPLQCLCQTRYQPFLQSGSLSQLHLYSVSLALQPCTQGFEIPLSTLFVVLRQKSHILQSPTAAVTSLWLGSFAERFSERSNGKCLFEQFDHRLVRILRTTAGDPRWKPFSPRGCLAKLIQALLSSHPCFQEHYAPPQTDFEKCLTDFVPKAVNPY